ncbi:MAG: proline racemase family protein [Alphaproteobacteria bacterium]
MLKPSNDKNPYSIGHVAKVIGVSVSTLRSWENAGLIDPFKSASGHRSFSSDDMDRIRNIEQMRRLSGHSLTKIKELIDSEPDEQKSVTHDSGIERTTVDFGKIGARIRTMRKESGLSLRALSEKTDIGVSHLSMFERGTAFLSPARLNSVALAFGRSLAELLGGTHHDHVPIVRRGAGRVVGTFGPGVSVEQLTVAEKLMDVEVWTIEPGAESDGYYSHDGEELIYILSGEFEVTLAGRPPAVLQPGDSAYFNSSLEHRWRNPGSEAARVLWVNTDAARVSAMQFDQSRNRFGLGVSHGSGLGEGTLDVQLAEGAETFRVLETHTAGHPTRILIESLPGLEGETASEKAQSFEKNHDHLRSLLLQEPRGHSGSFGLVPFASKTADFGAFFITSYGYPELCGHAVFGYAKALKSMGRLNDRTEFTIEMPRSTVGVTIHKDSDQIDVALPQAYVTADNISVQFRGRTVQLSIVYGGNTHAVIDAAALGLELHDHALHEILLAADELRSALVALDRPEVKLIESVLLFQTVSKNSERLFLSIDRNRYDRSPGVTGLAARMVQKVAAGQLAAGQTFHAESIFGGQLSGQIISIAKAPEGRLVCVPKISGRAHLNGISTLVLEPDDPLQCGFLGS